MHYRFLHAADVHLDSPLRGLGSKEGAPVDAIRSATRQALENLVDLAITEKVAFVLLAGDLYDGDWRDYNTGLFFVRLMSQLEKEGIQVFVVQGNHDAASSITRTLRLPDNVKLFSPRRAESVVIDHLATVVHGMSFPNREVSENLAAAYPDRLEGHLNIGLLHTSLDGREGHAPYAPCTTGDLIGKGYDYWALGHVHTREEHEDPWIVFPGNIQGRHIRETGPKGCTVVEVRDGAITSVEERILDVFRWASLSLDVSDTETEDQVLEHVRTGLALEAERAQGRPVAVRVELKGATTVHGSISGSPERWNREIQAVAFSAGENVWIEKVRIRTRAQVDVAELLDREDVIGGVLSAIRDLDPSDDDLLALAVQFKDLRNKLPAQLRAEEEPLDPMDLEQIRSVVQEAGDLAFARLLRSEVES